ncbi:MAG: PQQ-binding-like beta-propeller repeat protein [Planctomycetales bacterium]|nr:PQQ-binding-like beta-propeller repeat protein [Planctomycetales bacterium]
MLTRSVFIGFVICFALFVFVTSGIVCGADRDAPRKVDDGFQVLPQDWPWWRGPLRNGTATADQDPPLTWSETENVVWKVPVAGRGYSSPIVVGQKVFLASADESTGAQYVLAFDRETGNPLWRTVVHESGGMRKNNKSTMASSTLACDGQRLFINFPNSDALFTTALDLDGNKEWETRLSSYVVHQGYGASPTLYQNLVIVSSDNKGGGVLAGLEAATGKLVWEQKRRATPNYPSPTLVQVGGRDQVIMVGCDQVVSYAPLTGEKLWEIEGATTECVTSTLTDGNLIYTSGGYPRNHMSAIRADGNPEVVWENATRLYVPSMVIRDGYLYGVLDAGIATCWEAATGNEMWKARLGGTFSSSAVLVGERIYATNEAGETFVFKAQPTSYELLSKTELGTEVLATPTIVGGRIYHRVAHLSPTGDRQEMLYCIGK